MRRKALGAFFVILLVLFVAPSAKADFAIGKWKFVKSLVLPSEGTAGKPVELLIGTDVSVNA